MTVDISVVICVRDGAKVLRRQLVALDAQVDHPDFEVVVVDNGSSDGTAALVRDWIAEPVHAAATVRLVDGGRIPGIPHARNVGALHAQGRVLAYCDADDEVDPRWVGAMARAVDADQLAGGRILARTATGEDCSDTFTGALTETRYLPHVGNCNCAISRATLFAVGGYDESLPAYGFEDVDLSWRVQEAGFPLLAVEDAIVHFTLGATRSTVRKRFRLGEGRVLMALRYPEYDGHRYTVPSTLVELFRALRDVVVDTGRNRKIDRELVSRTVANAGRVAGAIKAVRHRGSPRRLVLLPGDEVPS